jgi:hypothetical protein
VKLEKAKTVNGQNVSIAVSDRGVSIDSARVVKTDIDATNGVIHVIDSVIMPKTEQASAPRDHIIDTINHGSRLYNTGHHKACADLYMTSARELMKMSIDASVADHLNHAVNKSERMHCQTSRAWTMRHALDAALASLSQ